ncbi:hypothetical protein [Photobacterium sp. TY1-4]|uniref:hypothetical protein n=1 Tax=Photobacterium sp. TY1-4 TaxID=2899122 RepID=UPI0021C01884|nr:hypothetical protein [Photobacterium sp. TY1-4]UXI02341.1 hypothetical protein NH461_06060 [Photobacterium sp. TY1-4]
MMKHIITALLILWSFFSWATTPDKTILNALNQSIVVYEAKHNKCIEFASENILSHNIINIIKKIDVDLASSLGYLYKEAIYKCSLNELSSLMKLIMIIETSDDSDYQNSRLRVKEFKRQLFTKVDLRLESKFQGLSREKKTAILNVGKTLAPFNMVDAYERIQLE